MAVASKPKRARTMPAKIASATPVKPKITFEQGLMVKEKASESKTQKQVFKEKEGNILAAIQGKTRALEDEAKKESKDEVLERLRKSAQQINAVKKQNPKKKTALDEEVEEDLLSKLDEEPIEGEDEEEY